MRKLLLVSFLVLFYALQTLHAQQVDSMLARYDKKVPQEKLHLHFDNSLYTPGQNIWYKAYLIKDIEPSGMSKNLYIDWFDEGGKLLSRSVAPIINATAAGNFTIPKNFTGNNLQVMAYTKWMLNFDSSFLFHQTLRIAQPALILKNEPGIASTTSLQNQRPIITTTLQFFPEGGDMVENIPGNIAFKALNASGLPIPVSGTIYNKSRQAVAQFESEHDGMGKLLLTPLPGEVYTAEWKDPQGSIRATPLPQAKKSGIVLTLKNESVIRLFTVERSAVLEDRFNKIRIVASMNQQVVYNALVDLSTKTKISASLPATDFPSGVLQLTVFDNNMQPVTERVLFVNNEEYLLQADVRADSVNLEKRGKNIYQIELTDTIPASLSLSVMEGESSYDSSQNIISQLLLSSDIRGRVHDPGYYFASPEDSVAHHLDLVMLTNGWRRFAWDDVLTNKIPKLKYTADSGYLSLAGTIDKISERKMNKIDLVNLMLLSKDSSTQFIFTPLQPDGSFREDNLILFDTTKVYYRLNRVSIPVRSKVIINNTFLSFDSTKKNKPLPQYLPDTTGMARLKEIADEQKRLDALMHQTTLQEVVVTTKVKSRLEQMDETYTSGLFTGVMGASVQTFNVADDKNAKYSHTVFDYLRTRALRGGAPRLAGFKPLETVYFIDEALSEKDIVGDMPMSEVAYIKIYNSFVGAAGNAPAVVVYSKKGPDASDLFTGLYSTLLPGYTAVKEFYSPNYAEQQKMMQVDARRTLYWKPNIETSSINNKVKISFYNNDISHSFRIVLEGLAQDGRLIHVSKLLK
ncbi:MAG: hypothetical protein V4539_00550 [Bacteroidota bacterium]